MKSQPLKTGTLFWRPLGAGRFRPIALTRVGERVFRATLPALAATGEGIEYYVQADFGDEGKRVFPATAPALNQSVVVWRGG